MGRDRSPGRYNVPRTAGLDSFTRLQQEIRPAKGGLGTSTKVDLSVLKMCSPKQDVNMRKNPAETTVPAGVPQMPDAYLSFFDSAPPKLSQKAPTDPITHFRHEGLDVDVSVVKRKRVNHTTRCAAQTWTYSRDPEIQAQRENAWSQAAISQKVCIEPNGLLRYRMCGGEDLLPGCTKEYVKCDLPVCPNVLAFNDKTRLAYCVRGDSQERKPLSISNTQSKRIWDVMLDKGYLKGLQSESPGTVKADIRNMPAAGVVAIKESLDQQTESEDQEFNSKSYIERNRDPRDGPCPYQLGPRRKRYSKSLDPVFKPSNRPQSEYSTNNRLGEAHLRASSRNSRGHDSTEAALSKAASSKASPQDVTHQQTPTRLSSAPASRQSYVPSVQPWNAAPARETPTRSMTSRGSSLCMSPVSITNAQAKPRSASARSSTRSMQRSASR